MTQRALQTSTRARPAIVTDRLAKDRVFEFVFIVTLIQGEGPPTSIMPGVDRFAGIVGGLAILMVVSLVLWPSDQELAEQKAAVKE